MIGRLGDSVLQNRFLWMMKPGSVLRISQATVQHGGLGIHSNYHLMFNQNSTVEPQNMCFPPRPYHIKSNYEVSWNLIPTNTFIS